MADQRAFKQAAYPVCWIVRLLAGVFTCTLRAQESVDVKAGHPTIMAIPPPRAMERLSLPMPFDSCRRKPYVGS